MKKVLVTGSAGFVGSHFCEHILGNTDWKIIGLDSFRHRGDSIRVQADMDPNRYEVHYCDLSSPISHRLKEKIGHVDYIVNYASESHVDRSITNPVPFVQNNVNLILSILEYAREVKPEKFIQISTDEVYGSAPDGVAYSEWDRQLPSNPYAASKSAQESISISYWRTFGIPLIITNTMNIFGERQDREKFIPMIISKINNGENVTIHGSQEIIGSRFYLHARNQSDAILFILKGIYPICYSDQDELTHHPMKFNVVGDKELNNLEIAQVIADIFGKPLKYEIQDVHLTRPGHDRRYALNGTKFSDFGWRPPFTFEESIEKTIKWTLANPEWMK